MGIKQLKQRPNQARIVNSAVKSIARPFKSTPLYDQMIHIAISGGNGPGGAAEGRVPNLFFFKKRTSGFGRASRERPCLSAFRAKITARRAVFSSDLTSMSKK